MKLTNKTLRYSLTASLVLGGLLFTGCSTKSSPPISQSEINKIYKSSSNSKIRNSKAMHRATLRSYEVFGVRYYPKIANIGDEFRGIASWYGPNFHAKKTSNGETYNMYAMTAAHKTLPMNTMLRVLNLENGKSAIVRINDRGPFVDGRIIDLSNSAAHKVDMVRKGTVKVEITVLGYNGEIENGNAPHDQFPTTRVAKVSNNVNMGQKIESIEPMKIEEKTMQNNAVVSGDYGLQVGAFGRLAGAEQTQASYQSQVGNRYNVVIRKIFSNSRYLYKVFIKGFNSYNQAQSYKDSSGISNAIIIGNIK